MATSITTNQCQGMLTHGWSVYFAHMFSFNSQNNLLLLWWFSCSVTSDSLRPHGQKHTRLPCPPLSSGVCSNSCPLSWWCHPNHLIFCNPLLLLLSVFPNIWVFSGTTYKVPFIFIPFWITKLALREIKRLPSSWSLM